MLPTRSLLFFVFVALSLGFDALVIAEFFRKHAHERILCWVAFFRLGARGSTKILSSCITSVVVLEERTGVLVI